MRTITCKIPEELDAALDALARREKVSKSDVIRRAIEERLRRRRVRPTAFGLAKSLCGSLHGPRDLSSNPRHLDGLGA